MNANGSDYKTHRKSVRLHEDKIVTNSKALADAVNNSWTKRDFQQIFSEFHGCIEMVLGQNLAIQNANLY